jgi:hypothetical protein
MKRPVISKKKGKEPTLDQVTADVKRFVQRALDSERFCFFVAYVEDDTLHISEGRHAFPTGDFNDFAAKIAAEIRRAKGIK